MQEVVVNRYCDFCWDNAKTKTPAVITERLTLGTEELEVDTCASCDEVYVEPLRRVIKARAATARAAAKAAGDTRPAATARRREYRTWCGLCLGEMGLRSRLKHVEEKHEGVPSKDITWYFPSEVKQMWVCSCGLPFPSEASLRGHYRRAGHTPPADLAPQVPPKLPPAQESLLSA